jgi:multidrug efflux pump subunit AcrB
MQGFNLSDWALKHRSFVWYIILASVVAGVLSYTRLGREEDPSFTIKTMVISASMPGSTAEVMRTQVTDRIEKKLQELSNRKLTRSETFPGRAVVYLELQDRVRGRAVADTWVKVRNMMNDIRGDFPAEFAGFAFNDSFGDVYGNIYAFTFDGYSQREMTDRLETVRSSILSLDDAGKVQLLGTQKPVIHVEFSSRKLAALGLSRRLVLDTLSAQNAIAQSGVIRTGGETVALRLSGSFSTAEEVAGASLRAGGIFFTLADVATVTPGYEDPPTSLFRYNGKEAVGLSVGMREGANIVEFGAELDAMMARISAEMPIGIEMYKVADQPHVVEESVAHFVQALVEAVAIVLAVCFVSLGLRAGLVVTMTIPLVLAITFVFLDMMGITLQRISLGALIIALGLLVDDAMIAIETMITRMELGESRISAASYAWTSIAFPMLSGTLVTVAGFIPIGLNSSAAGEYTVSLFYVIAISLVASWFVAVLFAPLLGATFLPAEMKRHSTEPGRLRRMFHGILRASMRAKWLTISATVLVFGLSMYGMRYVEQQFFPTSDRPELLIDVSLRQNSSIEATDAVIREFELWLAERDESSFWTTYVGGSAPRFLLSLDSATPAPYTGQLVVMTPGPEARNTLRDAVNDYAAAIPGVEIFPKFIELGPPVGKPVQYRVSGPDQDVVREEARKLAAVMARDVRLGKITLDEGEPVRVVRVVLDQDRIRQLSLTQGDIAQSLATIFDGTTVTELRDGDTLVDIVARGVTDERGSVDALQSLQLSGANGIPIPFLTFASLEWRSEPPLIHQRDRVPTITVKAAVMTADQPTTIVADLTAPVAELRAALPAGYSIEIAGVAESSAESQGPIAAVAPLMILAMLTLVMIQMQSFRLLFIVMAVAPLGMIGVVAALLPTGAPLGFVAILGVLALIGILIRNSVILVHEIEVLVHAGRSRWDAVFEASDSRARPILLTAAAASLALIPIARQVFWGPMAISMMGGIIAGTMITLLFAPALYCAVFGVRPAAADPDPTVADPA